MQWAPALSSQESNEIEINWMNQTATSEFEHHILVRTTAEPTRFDQQSIFLKVLCHYLLNKIPDEGLPEMCRSMAEVFDYYVRAPRLVKGHEAKQLSVKAKTGQKYERPAFPIAEE